MKNIATYLQSKEAVFHGSLCLILCVPHTRHLFKGIGGMLIWIATSLNSIKYRWLAGDEMASLFLMQLGADCFISKKFELRSIDVRVSFINHQGWAGRFVGLFVGLILRGRYPHIFSDNFIDENYSNT